MTKKDYILIASILNLWKLRHSEADEFGEFVENYHELLEIFQSQLVLDNPRFDGERFAAACLK
jgi:hypothetical protein